MAELMDEAIAALRKAPSDKQDDLALLVLQLTGRETPLHVFTPEEEAELAESEAEADRGEFASDERIRAIWTKHGL